MRAEVRRVNFYRRYVGDYIRDTSHLSLAEHGAYTVLLDHYYATGRPMPASLDALNRLCRAMSKPEQDAVKSVAEQFFPVAGDGLRHSRRADIELEKAAAQAVTNRENGKGGGRPRKPPEAKPRSEAKENPTITQPVNGSGGERHPGNNPIPEAISHKPDTSIQKPESGPDTADKPPARRGRIADEAPPEFAELRAVYPKRDGDQRWRECLGHCRRRLTQGHTWAELIDGAKRYAAYVRAKGWEGTEHTKQAASFIGVDDLEKPFLLPWAAANPDPKKPLSPAERRSRAIPMHGSDS